MTTDFAMNHIATSYMSINIKINICNSQIYAQSIANLILYLKDLQVKCTIYNNKNVLLHFKRHMKFDIVSTVHSLILLYFVIT